MREMMQKALTAINARKETKVSDSSNRHSDTRRSQSVSPEDWGMSPEEALKATMVSGYK